MPHPPAIFLMGPTASGKSSVAIDIAHHFPVEIVSVDSAQIYRYLDIGSAKPDQSTQTVFPHHLIDLIDPDERYSAAQFRQDALSKMIDITARGNVPLLVGGTMLYFKALREGLANLPSADEATRSALERTAQERGWPAMHAILQQLDPATASHIQPHDSQRIQRALEVCYLTGRPMSELLAQRRANDFPYRVFNLALLPSDRGILHQRIERRFDTMLEMGLVDEVSCIRARFQLAADMPSMRCVGYRQVWMYLDNQISLAKMREMGVYATRQLAKRQLTWLRSMHALQIFDCLANDLSGLVKSYLQQQDCF
ncbi:MAG: tRNA (adenosine(37)-N6)-dimethylallyltransferase MiaA [Nitrosomonas halophila]|uniref:tRNA dimethylallyltransferase n=2 Tax=Nitrosomonas halophila TaxID=44576 RepID=A0A1H3HBM9_9PROT|nr:tRNA (adenosine(37)-N6)-dimethylallyltransferase MiaA [Nitrosomonas halophila]SDY12817.1 tRNA dimethylallyltransferase [Nitrosomonas halophila]